MCWLVVASMASAAGRAPKTDSIASQKSAAGSQKSAVVDSLGRPIKTGWNFGVLPSVAYDADYGFQGGALANIYYYGDGSQYPDYQHSLYVEASYSTKHSGIFRAVYDTRYLIPGHQLTIDATYLPDAMCDFYGYNGYQAKYNKSLHTTEDALYQTRAFYKYRRDFIRVAADIDGAIVGGLRWNAGLGVLGYILNPVDTVMLNRGKKGDKRLPAADGLYRKYQDWGLMSPDEARGGWHPYVRAGLTFDTRDKLQGPNRGLHIDAFLTYTAAFNAAYGQQAAAGYNHLTLNFAFRHYVPVYRDRVVFAYRLATQNTIAGRSPFYMNCYLNQLHIERMIYEGLGGANSLRGVIRNRVLANGFAYANVEWRFRVVDFDLWRQHFYVGLGTLFDIGVVTQPYQMDETTIRASVAADADSQQRGWTADDFFSFDKRDIYRPHMTAGLSLKVAMNENFCLSVDWAMPVNQRKYMDQDNSSWANFYVMMGYLF